MEKSRERAENLGNTTVIHIFAPPYGVNPFGLFKKHISNVCNRRDSRAPVQGTERPAGFR